MCVQVMSSFSGRESQLVTSSVLSRAATSAAVGMKQKRMLEEENDKSSILILILIYPDKSRKKDAPCSNLS